MRWYFPSKYNMQDFRIDEYFEMQAERFAEREPHRSMPALQEMLEKVSQHREELRAFFEKVDAPTLGNNPTLRDLYGMLQLVEPNSGWAFDSSFVRQEDRVSTLQAVGASATAGADNERDFYRLWELLKERLGPEEALRLAPRLTRARSAEEVRELLLEQAQKLNVVLPMDMLVLFEEGGGAELPQTASASSSRVSAVSTSEDEDAEAPHDQAPALPYHGEWKFGLSRHPIIISHDTGDGLQLRFTDRKGAAILGELLVQEEGHLEGALFYAETGSKFGDVHLSLNAETDQLDISLQAEGTDMPMVQQAHRLPAKLAESQAAMEVTAGVGAGPAADAAAEGHAGSASELETSRDSAADPPSMQVVARRRSLVPYLMRPGASGPSANDRAKGKQDAEKDLVKLRSRGARPMREYLARRHRFIDPMYRRRRLKWLERQMGGKNGEREVKFNSHYMVHPDDAKEWPSNKASPTVMYPSPYH